jgi:two-component system response regulator NreC
MSATTSTIRILLADDHGIVRQGLRAVLARDPALEVVGESADGRETIRLTEALEPAIVIMDIGMPHLNGIEATTQIVRSYPNIGVIILSMHSDEAYLLRALSAGAKGYLLKDSAEVDLVRAVHAVASGRPFFSPAITGTLLEDYLRNMQQRNLTDSWDLLTDREKEVLQLIAEGKSNKEVAAALSLSPYTVETHRGNLMQKLNLHNTAEIVLYAVRKKIIV